MECGSSLTACSAHGSTPGQFFCPGAQHSFCCKEHCCHLTSFDGRIIAQKSDFVNRHYRKREKKQEMGNGKLAQGCQSGVVGEGHALPAQHERLIQTDVKMVLAPELSLRGGRRPTWQSCAGSGSSCGASSKATVSNFDAA